MKLTNFSWKPPKKAESSPNSILFHQLPMGVFLHHHLHLYLNLCQVLIRMSHCQTMALQLISSIPIWCI